MNKEDLEIVAGEVAKELFAILYGEIDYNDDRLLAKMQYCTRVSAFVINNFMEKINEMAAEQ